jgi:hypothetical protein
MEFETLAALMSFVALVVVWAFVPTAAEEPAAAAAPAFGKVTA